MSCILMGAYTTVLTESPLQQYAFGQDTNPRALLDELRLAEVSALEAVALLARSEWGRFRTTGSEM